MIRWSARPMTQDESRSRVARWSPTTARCLGPVLLSVVLTLVPAAAPADPWSGNDASPGSLGPDQGLRGVVVQLVEGLTLASRAVVKDRGRAPAGRAQVSGAQVGNVDKGNASAGRAQLSSVHKGNAQVGTVWEWPLAGRPSVLRPFDAAAQRWLPGHRGVDLGGVPGEPVRAVADGVVAYSGVIAGVGVLSVQHPDGLRSTYQPLRDRIARGTQVSSGQVLGMLDSQGHCLPRTCLHLGAKREEAYLDPLLLLLGWEVSLLPLD